MKEFNDVFQQYSEIRTDVATTTLYPRNRVMVALHAIHGIVENTADSSKLDILLFYFTCTSVFHNQFHNLL